VEHYARRATAASLPWGRRYQEGGAGGVQGGVVGSFQPHVPAVGLLAVELVVRAHPGAWTARLLRLGAGIGRQRAEDAALDVRGATTRHGGMVGTQDGLQKRTSESPAAFLGGD
jgi:hypothetical protein